MNIGIAAAGVTVMVTSFGLPDVAARDLAVEPGRTRQLSGLVLTVRLSAVAFTGAIGIAIVAIVDPSAVDLAGFVAASALALAASGEWALRGLARLSAFATAMAVGGVVVLAGCAFVVPNVPTAPLAMGIFALGESVTAILAWRSVRPGRVRLGLHGVGSMMRRSWPVALSSLIVYAYYANVDTIILGVTRSAEEAGLYSAPYRLFLGVNTVAIFAAYALFQPYAAAVANGREREARAMLREALLPLVAYGWLVVGAAELIGGEVLRAMFGPEFGAMRAEFIILCLTVPWYCIGYPAGFLLVAQDASRRFLVGAAVAGGLSLALNLALIPPFGPPGAAAATGVALTGGSLTWLALHGMIDTRAAIVLCMMVVVSGGAVVAAVEASSARAIGAVTIAAGFAGLARYARRRDLNGIRRAIGRIRGEEGAVQMDHVADESVE